ncbi:MAG: excinuclease ABC subunit UvrA [Pseudomonadota bacterium]
MSSSFIRIRGARTHNLKNIDLDIPREKLIVFTGLSGSGKSSLAFDTLFAEGQRRYVESLSAYARQFLSMMDKPDVDLIEGLSPAIAIEQKTTSHNPRSTVGTVTEIYDYLRLLFARAGTPHCPDHDLPLEAQTVSQMVDHVLALPEDTRLMLLAPVISARKGEYRRLFDTLRGQGFLRVRINGVVMELDEAPELDAKSKHSIEVVVDRFKVRADAAQRLAESFETALLLAEGVAKVVSMATDDEPGSGIDLTFSARHACPVCGFALTELEPRLFSFNNPQGACPTCDGIGVQSFMDPAKVIGHPELSLAGGAIRGWDRRNAYYYAIIQSLGAHYGFSPETPWQDLPAKVHHVILHGSGKEKIEFHYVGERGKPSVRSHVFEGVLPNMQRRYRESDSLAVREELAKYLSEQPCPACGGARINRTARHVKVGEMNLPGITSMPVDQAADWFARLQLPGQKAAIADKIIREIHARLGFLVNVGLNYLSLERNADTLSGGEAQRIRLASQIGSGLVGVTYILDEPSIGLHQRDNDRLLSTLTRLRDLGNTVIVVEHDEDAIRTADFVVDIGPGAGVHGGRIMASGTAEEIAAHADSLTAQYLSGRLAILPPEQSRERDPDKLLTLRGARGNNLQGDTLEIPVGLLTCITGVSGSGKSTLINDTLYAIAARELNKASAQPAPYDSVSGMEHFDKVIDIDQSPIGRTPRSNPATYTGLFTPIRDLFAATAESRARGYGPGRFSFNVKGGRCEACEGDGMLKVEMHFLPDVYVECEVCKGKRYNRETLDIRYKGKTIADVLEMTVEDGVEFFSAVPSIFRKLQTLQEVGLGYLRLGQNATTLSGGEAQRVKLAKELSKRDTGRTLYILDEPTTGLHFHDVAQLLRVIHTLRDHGNTVVVIEHNLDVIKTADWVIDLGPEGGRGGGKIIAQGRPQDVANIEASHTGRYLQRFFQQD